MDARVECIKRRTALLRSVSVSRQTTERSDECLGNFPDLFLYSLRNTLNVEIWTFIMQDVIRQKETNSLTRLPKRRYSSSPRKDPVKGHTIKGMTTDEATTSLALKQLSIFSVEHEVSPLYSIKFTDCFLSWMTVINSSMLEHVILLWSFLKLLLETPS